MYNDLIGIPFDEHGDSKKGTNCYNLLRMAYAKHDIHIPATNISVCACTEVSNREIQDNVVQYWEPILTPGGLCGVLLLSTNPDFANHIGFYVGGNRMLHITKNTNSVIERMYPKYENKIIGFYKFTGGK